MRLDDAQLLVRIADSGSLTAAAKQLRRSPAAASAALTRLEEEIGLRLFERTTRSIHPTEEGAAVIEACEEILARWQRTLDELKGDEGAPSGLVRVSAPTDLSHQLIAPLLLSFCRAHPRVQLILDASDSVHKIHREAIDLALRYGALPDSSLPARKLHSSPTVLVAAPAYLKQHGHPQRAEELSQHRLLTLQLKDSPAKAWTLSDGETETRVEIQSPLCADGLLTRRWAIAGEGIARKSLFDVIEDLEAGRLIHVLPQLRGREMPIHLILPSRRFLPRRVRALTEAIVAGFAERNAQVERWLQP